MSKLEKGIIDSTRQFALANDIVFLNTHESLILNAIREAVLDKNKWSPKSVLPPKKDDNFSKSVLIHSPYLDLYSIGWYDYELKEWMYIGDEEMRDFVWTTLPKFSKRKYAEPAKDTDKI